MSEALHRPSGLQKAIWTDADFDDMGWHDARIYAMGVHDDERGAVPATRLLFDLDYIVRWLDPVRPARTYTFWIAPATLVFERVWGLTGSLEHVSELEVADLHRAPSPDEYPDPLWHVDGQAFDLRFRAPGFVQYFRRPPLHVPGQGLSMAQRGGISLAEAAFAPDPSPPR